MPEQPVAPEFLTEDELDEMLGFLDEVRESGATNMFGAAPYLREMFGLEKGEARTMLSYWMKTFSARHPNG